jgi:NhaA family Na+:H+ antiporter
LAPFLVLLAAAADAFGMIAVAPRALTTFPDATAAAAIVAAIALAAALRRAKVLDFWPYLAICGSLSWFAFLRAGLHPALALVPIVPFLPREPRRRHVFTEVAPDDHIHRAEYQWHDVVQVILFFFGLVNGGVLVKWYDTGTWAVLAAALVARPLGVLAAVGLASVAGLRLPPRIGWREVAVIALATTSGFTFALFFATSTLPIGPALTQIKIGALFTAAGAAITFAAAWLLRVGRFARHAAPRTELLWHSR